MLQFFTKKKATPEVITVGAYNDQALHELNSKLLASAILAGPRPPIEVMEAQNNKRFILTYYISPAEARHAFEYEWFNGPGYYYHRAPDMPQGPCNTEDAVTVAAWLTYCAA